MSSYPEVSDTLLHGKTKENTEVVVLPVTRYTNVLNAPKVLTSATNIKDNAKGAPFVIQTMGITTVDSETLNKLTGINS